MLLSLSLCHYDFAETGQGAFEAFLPLEFGVCFASSFLNCMQTGFNFLLPKNIWQRFIGNQNTRHRRDFIASCHSAGTFETGTQKARAAKNVSLAEGFVLSIFGSGYARLGFRASDFGFVGWSASPPEVLI